MDHQPIAIWWYFIYYTCSLHHFVCQQLQNTEEQCQCEAVKQVFREAQQQIQKQGPQSIPFLHSQQAQRLKQKAQILPNVCNLQSRRCEIGTIITTVTESNIDISFRDRPFGTGSQQCRETEIQRPVGECQMFVEQQMQQSPRSTRPYQQRPCKNRLLSRLPSPFTITGISNTSEINQDLVYVET
ncbi:2S seed storage protein-like [Helianthus annuus]|uniref:2S seed storage protein-like n=1 Tax=Helianthus annuus TaxID=4232 RepID=UPI0016531254|nr:2S seed storage protein-like [Helianthus annuus]